jgi:hypothetical protein
MAINFAKKAASKPAETETSNDSPQTSSPPKTEQKQAQTTGGSLSWMKKGSAAKAAMAHEEAKAEQKKAEAGKLWRYWMPAESSREITFLDGEVDSDGMLDVPCYYEHNIQINGNWEQFVCTQEAEGHCVICNMGSHDPSFVGVMTVCDHSSHTVKKGPNAGKEIVNQRKLFVAKRESLKLLSKLAWKRGGLTGCRFDVTRGNDRSPSVGSQFDFTEKLPLDEVADKYGLKIEEVQPANYAEEITMLTNEQLLELGVGKKQGGPGYEKGAGKDLKSQL